MFDLGNNGLCWNEQLRERFLAARPERPMLDVYRELAARWPAGLAELPELPEELVARQQEATAS